MRRLSRLSPRFSRQQRARPSACVSGRFTSAFLFLAIATATGTTDAALHDDARLNTGANTSTSTQDRGLMSPLLYPVFALPTVYTEIFSPPSPSPWPFSYDAIFQAAFARTASDQNSKSCPQTVGSSVIVDRIRNAVRPTPDQMQQLQKLGGALGVASDYLGQGLSQGHTARPRRAPATHGVADRKSRRGSRYRPASRCRISSNR